MIQYAFFCIFYFFCSVVIFWDSSVLHYCYSFLFIVEMYFILICSLRSAWIIFSLGLLLIKLLEHSSTVLFVDVCFHFGGYLRSEFAEGVALDSVCFTWKETVRLFSWVIVPFYTPASHVCELFPFSYNTCYFLGFRILAVKAFITNSTH